MANYTKFQAKKAEIEVLCTLNDHLDEMEKDTRMSYQIVGKEDEQAKDWRTGDLLWEDEEKTVPKYHDKYGYVPKTDLTAEDEARLAAIVTVRSAFDKLM